MAGIISELFFPTNRRLALMLVLWLFLTAAVTRKILCYSFFLIHASVSTGVHHSL